MDFDLQNYKSRAAIHRKLGLVGLILGSANSVFLILLALMAIFEGRSPGELWTWISIFGWMMGVFSIIWVWGRETQGLVAEIEMLRAMKLPETRPGI